MKNGYRYARNAWICAQSIPALLLASLFVFTACSKDPVATETPPTLPVFVGCISYYDVTNNNIKTVLKTGDSWGTPEAISVPGTGAVYGATVIDSRGNPHVCYHNAATHTLNYAVYSNGSWLTTVVDNDGNAGFRCSIAVDTDDNPHISYLRGPGPPYGQPNSVRHAWLGGDIWYKETVPVLAAPYGGLTPYQDYGHPTSIDVDALGNPHISYATVNGHLEYAVKTVGSGWAAETVDMIDNVGAGCSLVLDASGNPHIGYNDWTHKRIKYTWNNGTTWDTETILTGDLSNAWAYPVSLALGARDLPHISYYTTGLKLGYLEKSTGGAWAFEIVDGSPAVGAYSSLAIDAQGSPHIGYWDYTNGHVKYAVRSGGVWTVDTIDNSGGVGQYASFALGYR